MKRKNKIKSTVNDLNSNDHKYTKSSQSQATDWCNFTFLTLNIRVCSMIEILTSSQYANSRTQRLVKDSEIGYQKLLVARSYKGDEAIYRDVISIKE